MYLPDPFWSKAIYITKLYTLSNIYRWHKMSLMYNCARFCAIYMLKKPQTSETARFFEQNKFLPMFFRLHAQSFGFSAYASVQIYFSKKFNFFNSF